ncbi:carbon starvation protein A [Salipaludibacillus agaradhaerens]|uniref:carbon starvation CstA family protein n=1 Tax=Salipaludibacillus agaradhaerens TaxID=76935 RepID=UPI0021519AE2|nr:carbon starvation CstA family protein [Salipaludibacillus agaradhaerens]MCR6105925.1 carbon starvation protein A [Salipaludibacillus agaradhaerens]MCR6117958.1 carbon starvation protein A [Salipaludibacillus agaradhaerens]
MITFMLAIVFLIIGYLTYSKVVERIFGINDNDETPTYTRADGLDYVPMSWWKGSLIQLLNIAGLGPIFGAILGALYGPVAFIWIVVGCIFAGAVHDYFSGMLSLRHSGEQYPTLVGRYLGKTVRICINFISIILMILVAAAFTAGPAELIAQITPLNFMTAILIIFSYFLLAALLPVNKIIGRIYPFFGAVLIFMAVSVAIALLFTDRQIPNLTLANLHPGELPLWPLLMVTISCGAISGFHSTQSPIIARTLKKESDGRKVFYGAMIAEGVITLIWATAGMTFFGNTTGLQEALAAGGTAGVVNEISTTLLGTLGGVLAILGVIFLPITTGDTAIRSSRMMVIELLNNGFKKMKGINDKTLIMTATIIVTVPAFFLSLIDYAFLWRYVGWTNQVVATVMLWTGAMYLLKNNKPHWICSVPAMFMSAVVCMYIFYAPEGFNLNYNLALIIGSILTLTIIGWFIKQIITQRKDNEQASKVA